MAVIAAILIVTAFAGLALFISGAIELFFVVIVAVAILLFALVKVPNCASGSDAFFEACIQRIGLFGSGN